MQKGQVTEFRHEPKRAPDGEGALRVPRVAILGGGFAGAATAIKLLDTGTRPLQITVVEPRTEIGRGPAYSTRDAGHLMNGPAKLFSLYPERPEHFAQFLARFAAEWNWRDPLSADFVNAFAPRSVFGDYVRAELARAVSRAAPLVSLEHVAAEATDLRRRGGRVELGLSNGQTLLADHAILAVGAVPSCPDLPLDPAVAASPRYIPDPWNLEAFERVPRTGRVLLLGTGLTMLDALVTLERRGFAGRYTAISRRGLLVHPRREVVPLRDFLADAPLPTTVRGLLRAARLELSRTTQGRPDWQSLVMAIRPHVPALWQRASEAERARFVRHLRPIWETSLHRAPPRSAQLLERGRAEGWFAHRASRIVALEPAADGQIVARLSGRGRAEIETLVVDAVVNCTGVTHDWSRAQSPLMISLLATGAARPGPLSFGIDADWQHAVIGRDGLPAPDLSAIGHPLRGVRWESSTLLELLQQAIQLANRLSGQPVAADPGRVIAASAG